MPGTSSVIVSRLLSFESDCDRVDAHPNAVAELDVVVWRVAQSDAIDAQPTPRTLADALHPLQAHGVLPAVEMWVQDSTGAWVAKTVADVITEAEVHAFRAQRERERAQAARGDVAK